MTEDRSSKGDGKEQRGPSGIISVGGARGNGRRRDKGGRVKRGIMNKRANSEGLGKNAKC